MLPHVLAFKAAHAPEAGRRIAAAFEAPTACEGLAAVRKAVNAPIALRACGMPEDGIGEAVEPILARIPKHNPAPVTSENLTALLRDAWEGHPP